MRICKDRIRSWNIVVEKQHATPTQHSNHSIGAQNVHELIQNILHGLNALEMKISILNWFVKTTKIRHSFNQFITRALFHQMKMQFNSMDDRWLVGGQEIRSVKPKISLQVLLHIDSWQESVELAKSNGSSWIYLAPDPSRSDAMISWPHVHTWQSGL